MRLRTLAVGAAMLAATAFAPNLVAAASLPGAVKTGIETPSMVEQVRHRGHRHHGHRHHFHRHHHHHHHWRHRHFRPYLYGYGGGYSYGYGRCTRVRHICADRWGWRTRQFYRCVYNRGC
ncbi:hypothetical protein [uncultured Hyphomicrobium sp.]|uniref:hypothetical protein n=1 Tax=uncultured Hyphomicrobium sp. TaxID=194373 RepID=UPI0025E3CF52|nr:hypothetical protein [uncultured Hyphomicrobium sp.]